MSRDILARSGPLKRSAYRLGFLIGQTLPLWLVRTVGYIVGLVMYVLDARGRRIVRRNMSAFIPAACPEARTRTARRAFTNFCSGVGESFAMHRLPQHMFVPPGIVFADPFGVFAARPLRGPLILLSVHSNMEFALAACHHLRLTEDLSAIALGHGDPAIDELFERMRNRVGCRSLLFDRAPLAALRALKQGKSLVIVGERDYTGNGIEVRFAGRPLVMPVGPAALSIQTGAPVIPCLFARLTHCRFMYLVGRPIQGDPSLPKDQQIRALTQRMADVLCRFVAATPGQWATFHDVWPMPRKGASSTPQIPTPPPASSAVPVAMGDTVQK